MKIYTRKGDKGGTDLFGGGRVDKDHPRVDAYGDVDELNATIGVARAHNTDARIDEILNGIQRDLFSIGALLATPDREKMQQHLEKAVIGDARVKELESFIDECDRDLEPLKAFILPGGSPGAAALHFSRTVCRRTERRVVGIARNTDIPADVIVYLNRLSDLLFTLARFANKRAGSAEQNW